MLDALAVDFLVVLADTVAEVNAAVGANGVAIVPHEAGFARVGVLSVAGCAAQVIAFGVAFFNHFIY